MRPRILPRRLLTAGTATAVCVLLTMGTAGTAVARTTADRPAAGYGRLLPLADLSAQRLLTADLVAAAKWGTDSPIDDPARERQVLDEAARRARELGADPEATVRIFRDQIEANKVVQRGLYRRWQADPSQAPTERPDLTEVRERINRINGELVRAVAVSAQARKAPQCGARLAVGAVRVAGERHLDPLHGVALARALPSVCAPSGR